MTRRLYVGIVKGSIVRDVFRSAVRPTERTHGSHYAAVIGPFRTRRAADLMTQPGARYADVAAAERAARIEQEANR